MKQDTKPEELGVFCLDCNTYMEKNIKPYTWSNEPPEYICPHCGEGWDIINKSIRRWDRRTKDAKYKTGF